MIIDLIFLGIVLLALFKGWQKGLIVAIFSVVAFVLGLAAAMKLSAVVAAYLDDTTNVSARWLPFLSFLLVFIAVILLVRLGGRLLEKAVEAMWMGWVNKLGGILFYLIAYTIIYSILLFFIVQVRLIDEVTIEKSVTYAWIRPWGPFVIDSMGKIIPFFRDMFTQLEGFFDHLAR